MDWFVPDRSTARMSACLPISSEPMRSSIFSALAPPMVASSNMVAESRKVRVSRARFISSPTLISENMSVESVAAGESVPSPMRKPDFRYSLSGAMPMPRRALARGHMQMDTPCSRILLMSSSSTCTA